MNVRDIMTSNPACCTRDAKIQEAARLMVEHDCGEIPVVEDQRSKKLVGVITDRDITCRAVAMGKSPNEITVGEIMSSPVVCATEDTSLEECCQMMEENKIRRVPVVDANDCCCGIVAQADIALHAGEHETAEVVRDVSEPGSGPSNA